jgi:CO/xanthine dehydrogenase FAD-binding subunit
MKPPPFEYVRPESLDEALSLLDEDAKPLAGGQSLVPMLNMRLVRPTRLVDLNRVPGLDRVVAENGTVRIGALVRQRTLEDCALPLVVQALPHLGHYVTRNRGTVGGSLAHADAAAELPLCLVLLGGSVVTRSARGQREIPAEDFFVTHFTTALAPDELVVDTLWPAPGPGWGFAFEELSQRHGDFGLAMAACALRLEHGCIAEARVGIGSVVERPTLVETALVGESVTEELARETGVRAAEPLTLFGNLHAPAEYQRRLTAVLVERAVLRAYAEALS